MKLIVSSILPAPGLSRADQFPVHKKKWLSRPSEHRVNIGPDQAAVILESCRAGSVRLCAPPGVEALAVPVAKPGLILMFHREFTLTLTADQFCFKNGMPGNMSLIIKLRIINPANPFSAFFAGAREQDLKNPGRFILNRISQVIAPVIETCAKNLVYTAGLTPMDVTGHLKDKFFMDRITDSFSAQAGLKPLGPLVCTEVCAPLADDARERRLMHVMKNKALTLEAQTALHKLRLETKIEAAKSENIQASAKNNQNLSGLALLTCWRSYNHRGQLTGMPGSGDPLPSGSGLDVMIFVSRDAWVYVVNFSSAGKWQQMVPEPGDAPGKIMHLTRTHFQHGQHALTWPGENNHPDRVNRLPLWRLNADTGTEQLYVIASQVFIDMEALIANGGIHDLVKLGKPSASRCFESFCLSGTEKSDLPGKKDVVVQELTIRHL